MAIAFNNASDLGSTTGTSKTSAYTVGSGTNRLLLVSVIGDNGGTDDITGVTYATVSMTLIQKGIDITQDRFIYLYYLLSPTSGANNVVVSCTNSHFLSVGAADYANVAQSVPDNSTKSLSASGAASWITSLTTVADNCWTFLVEGSYNGTATDPTAGTGSTRRAQDASNGTWGFFDSNGPITPAGSYSMTTVRTPPNAKIVHLMASFAPFVNVTSSNAKRDNNRVAAITGVLNTDGTTILPIYVNPSNHALKVVDATSGTDYSTPNAQRDANRVPTIWGVSNADGVSPVSIYVDSNNNLLIDSN